MMFPPPPAFSDPHGSGAEGPGRRRGDALKFPAVRRSCGVGEVNTGAQVEPIGRAPAGVAKERRPKLFEESHDTRTNSKLFGFALKWKLYRDIDS